MMKKNYSLSNVFKSKPKTTESTAIEPVNTVSPNQAGITNKPENIAPALLNEAQTKTYPADNKEIKGYFEGISEGMIRGWVFSLQTPDKPLEVELLLNGKVIAQGKTILERDDVAEAFQLTNNQLGFAFDLIQQNQRTPFGLGDELAVRIKSKSESKSLPLLPGSPVIINETLIANQWLGFFEGISPVGILEGWAFNQLKLHKPSKIYLHLDDVLVTSTKAETYRLDVANTTAKTDGKAGFFVVLELTADTLPLLKSGAKLDVSFDEQNQYPLPGSGIILEKTDVDLILQMMIKHIGHRGLKSTETALVLGLAAHFETYLAEETNETQKIIVDDNDNLKKPPLLDYALLSVTVIRTAHQLQQLGHYEQLLAFLCQVDHPEVLRFCQLEFSLLQVMALTAIGSLTEAAIVQLDSDFFERSNDKEAKQQSLLFSHMMDVTVVNFCTLLQTKIVALTNKSDETLLLGQLVFVLSRWTYRLNANPRLALNFLPLLQASTIDLFATAEVQNHLAHLYRELGDNLEALRHCLLAIKQDTDYWWVYHEAAVITRLLCDRQSTLFRNAIEQIYHYFCLSFRLSPYQSKSVREFKSALQSYFYASHDNTWQLAEAGFIEEALREREYDLKLITYAMMRCYSGEFHTIANQPSLRKMPGKQIIFVGSRGLFQCFYYRVKQKLEQAEALNLSTRYLDLSDVNQIDWQKFLMNAAVLYACRIPATITEINLLCYAKGLGIPIVYDIDDLIFDAAHFPAPLETYANTIDEKTHLHLTMDNPFFVTALRLADVCVVSTQALAKQVALQIKAEVPIKIHPNVFSYELYYLAKMRQVKTVSETVTILYGSATKAHKQSFYTVFLPAVLKVLKQVPEAQLLLIGHFEGISQALSKQIKILEPTPNYLSYIDLVKTADINIAILEQSPLTDTKSEIKWLEAAGFEIPSIVTPTQTYREVLTEGETVLFAATQAEWESQLLRLLADKALRKKIGVAAKQLAFEKFSPQIGEGVLRDTVIPLLESATPVIKKTRVLLVNVYFYPQSVGGATRVFENQVRGLMERYPDDYEIFVLTTEADPDSGKPYYVEQYWFQNALVTRLNVPTKYWTEYEDGQVLEFCLKFFADYKFDVIHFHSIQILTASVVNAALKLNIPYLITLHDAWWISIFQFLVNPEGELVDHTSPLNGVSKEDLKNIDWILNRWRELHHYLSKAHQVVAVSEKFAQLYREAGNQNVGVHENYPEPFTALPRKNANPGEIVLGFIGGMSTHKGYDLFRKALEDGNYSSLRAIVINHSLHAGEVHSSVWGTTPVEFRAKVKQSEVAELYAQFDVLVSPSIWPESYGLVTREALQAGLWVISSNRGAIGDCIIEGVNGNIVDVEDHLGLMQAFDALPEQLAKQRENPAAAQFDGGSVEVHLQQLVTMYQSALGKVS